MKYGAFGLMAGLSLLASPAMATDDLIEGAKLCTRQLPHYEREYGIPTHLLSAIASTESGRYHSGLGLRIPWPWTINADGKGYYFNSKEEAIAAVQKLQSHGVKSIDVGCMQVNLHHHGNAFASLDEAFEPRTNVAYAASFLRNLYQDDGSWKKAAADYHSKTATLGKPYAGQVYDSWYQILEKLRSAKLAVPADSVAALSENPSSFVNTPAAPKTVTVAQATQSEDKPYGAKSATKLLAGQAGKKLPELHARMNLVQLSTKDASHENGVIVVRPDITPASMPVVASRQVTHTAQKQITVADAKQDSSPGDAMSEPKVIHVSAPATQPATRKSGPTFIFND